MAAVRWERGGGSQPSSQARASSSHQEQQRPEQRLKMCAQRRVRQRGIGMRGGAMGSKRASWETAAMGSRSRSARPDSRTVAMEAGSSKAARMVAVNRAGCCVPVPNRALVSRALSIPNLGIGRPIHIRRRGTDLSFPPLPPRHLLRPSGVSPSLAGTGR